MAIWQTYPAPTLSTLAGYLLWANTFGKGASTMGWLPQTGHGEVVATGSGSSYTWSNVTAPSTAQFLPAQSYVFMGAFVPSATYTGIGTSLNAAGVNLVTYNGLTYCHLTTTSSLATTPDVDTTNWAVFNYEIWKSNGPMSSTLPIYIRIVYCANAGSPPFPRFHLSIGTGVDVNGNITGGAALSSNAPLTNIGIDPGSITGNTTPSEFDLSGDADNLRWIWWRGYTLSTSPLQLWVIDRAKTSSGTDSNAFVYVGSLSPINTGARRSGNSILMNSSFQAGGSIQNSTTGWLGAVWNAGFSVTTQFGTAPPYPITPMVGFQANPLLGAMGFAPGDVPDGTVASAWVYGASHNFLMCSVSVGSVANMSIVNVVNGTCAAIRWE